MDDTGILFADDFEQLYRQCDIDGNGTIDRQEMFEFIKKLAMQVLSPEQSDDDENNGFLKSGD